MRQIGNLIAETSPASRRREELVTSICGYHCNIDGCIYQAVIRDGRVVRTEPHPDYPMGACPKMLTMVERLYHPERLRYPMKRVGEKGEGKWQRLSWDEALDYVAQRLNQIKEKYGPGSVVLYHHEAQYPAPGGMNAIGATIYRLLGLWGGFIPAYARGGLCWRAYIEAMGYLFGTTAVMEPPHPECKLVMVWGWNPIESGLGISERPLLFEAKEKGTKFVVIDPVFTPSAALLADEYLPIRPGADAALAWAMLNIMMKEGLYNKEFVLQHTNASFLVRKDNGKLLRERDIKQGGSEGFLVMDSSAGEPRLSDAVGIIPALEGSYQVAGTICRPVWQVLKDTAVEWTPERASAVTELPAEKIVKVARLYGKSRPAIIPMMCPSYNRASWGENNVFALGILRAINGSLLGAASVAFTDPGEGPFSDIGFLKTTYGQRARNPVKVRFPKNRFGEAILNPKTYGTNIKAAYILLGDPVNQGQNSNKTIEAMKALEFCVVHDAWMTPSAQYADVVLPVAMGPERTIVHEVIDSRDPHHTKYYLGYSEKAVEPEGEAKDDFEIIRLLAGKMGFGSEFPWQDTDQWIADMLGKARENPKFPWLKDITMERLKREKIVRVDVPQLPHRQPNWKLRTPSGRIELYSERLLEKGFDPVPIYREPEEGRMTTPELFAKYPLNLVSAKSLFSSHSSLFNTPTLLKIREPHVLIHPKDAAARGIADGDAVVLFNDRGKVDTKALVAERIKPGVVRIYEGIWIGRGGANTLTSDRTTTYGENSTANTCLVQVKKRE